MNSASTTLVPAATAIAAEELDVEEDEDESLSPSDPALRTGAASPEPLAAEFPRAANGDAASSPTPKPSKMSSSC